jgi:cytochrome c oxidase assembly protein subunit 15
MFFFPVSRWVGGIFYEHSHRLVASSVGLMTTILALWLYGRKGRGFLRWAGLALLGVAALTWLLAPVRWADAVVAGSTGGVALAASFVWPSSAPAPAWLRRLGVAAFFAVVLQGVLGGLRVILFKDQIGIFHAALAQLFFVMVCSIALFTSSWWRRTRAEGGMRAPESERLSRLRWLLLGSSLLILSQLVVGATMRHQHAGLSIPDFPLAYGKLWPAIDPASVAGYNQHRLEVTAANPITAAQIVLQMVHRLLALAILFAVGLCAWTARRRLSSRSPIARGTLVWVGLIVVQVLLGAATIWSNKAADVATGHVLVGALSLAVGSLLCIVAFTQAWLGVERGDLPAAKKCAFSGARPSSGAAMSASQGSEELRRSLSVLRPAAPEDGRTPETSPLVPLSAQRAGVADVRKI